MESNRNHLKFRITHYKVLKNGSSATPGTPQTFEMESSRIMVSFKCGQSSILKLSFNCDGDEIIHTYFMMKLLWYKFNRLVQIDAYYNI